MSLTLTDHWNIAFIDLQRQILVDDDGEVELQQTTEQVRHASDVSHVGEHRDWITDTAVGDVQTGQALWDIREAVFPHLRFLPRVKDDLLALQPVWVRSVTKILTAFEKVTAAWDRSQGIAPAWPTKVTPEHEQRKALCSFDDPEGGGSLLFDTHTRFTPWAGRIHFRWDVTAGKVVISYIGEKL